MVSVIRYMNNVNKNQEDKNYERCAGARRGHWLTGGADRHFEQKNRRTSQTPKGKPKG